MPKNNKFILTISGINIHNINKKFNIKDECEKNETDSCIENTYTKLNHDNPKEIIITGNSKQKHICNTSMIDFNTSRNVNFLKYNYAIHFVEISCRFETKYFCEGILPI